MKKIGTFAWLSFATAGAEALVWLKLSHGQFPHLEAHPTVVVACWAICFACLAIFTMYYFYIGKCHLKRQSGIKTNQTQATKKNK